jgi:hypothetical protein
MKRTFRFWLLGALAIAFAVAVAVALSQLTFAQGTPQARKSPDYEVVLMRCKSSAEFGIKAYQGSPGTPVKKSGKCAENLSLLLRDGFKIHDIGHYDLVENGFVVYTLVR